MARKDPFTTEQQSVRVLKVGERVRHILSELLARGEVHDDVVSASTIAVTEVRMTPDLRIAMAYVKPLQNAGEDEVVKALRQNTAFLQREVAKRLGLKFAPKLQFRKDESYAEADRIEQLLRDPKVSRDLGDDLDDNAGDDLGDDFDDGSGNDSGGDLSE
jgi:ribosome-binding factor A